MDTELCIAILEQRALEEICGVSLDADERTEALAAARASAFTEAAFILRGMSDSASSAAPRLLS